MLFVIKKTPAAIDRLSVMSIPDSDRRIAWIEASHMDCKQQTPIQMRHSAEEPSNIYRAAFGVKASNKLK